MTAIADLQSTAAQNRASAADFDLKAKAARRVGNRAMAARHADSAAWCYAQAEEAETAIKAMREAAKYSPREEC